MDKAIRATAKTRPELKGSCKACANVLSFLEDLHLKCVSDELHFRIVRKCDAMERSGSPSRHRRSICSRATATANAVAAVGAAAASQQPQEQPPPQTQRPQRLPWEPPPHLQHSQWKQSPQRAQQ